MATPAFAGTFINGGFEDGSFNGWTKDGGSYNGSYYPSGDPGKSAIVSLGTDPYSGLNTVYSGNYAARINNYDNWYHYSTIRQTVTDWSDNSIYFAYAAVLEDPGHDQAGHMRVTLLDEDTQTPIYDVYFDYYSAGGVMGSSWHLNGGWGYTDWTVVNLDTSNYLGHDLTLTLLASDCGWGGHGGYAYLDGFGAAPPPPGPGNPVPEPATMLLFGAGAAGIAAIRRRKNS